jgi:hypothetical protein
MDISQIDDLVAECSRRKVPELPGAFATDVLREIRLRTATTKIEGSWFATLARLCLLPRTLALSAMAAALIGAAAPVILAHDEAAAAASGLDLEVFSSTAFNLPSGLLARTR